MPGAPKPATARATPGECAGAAATAIPRFSRSARAARIWESARAVDDGELPAAPLSCGRQRRDAARAYAERSYRLFAPLLRRQDRPLSRHRLRTGRDGAVLSPIAAGTRKASMPIRPCSPFTRSLRSVLASARSRTWKSPASTISSTSRTRSISSPKPMRLLGQLRRHLAPDGVLCVVLSDFMSSLEPNLPSYSHTFYPCAALHALRARRSPASRPCSCEKRSGSIYMAARPAAAAPTESQYDAHPLALPHQGPSFRHHRSLRAIGTPDREKTAAAVKIVHRMRIASTRSILRGLAIGFVTVGHYFPFSLAQGTAAFDVSALRFAGAGAIVAAIVATLVLAWLSNRLVERPGIELGRMLEQNVKRP